MTGLSERIRSTWGATREAWRFGRRPPPGAVVVPESALDGFRQLVSDHLDYKKLRSILRSSYDYDLATGLSLFEEMQAKDATLYSVANTRRKALTGLDHEIVSAADVQEVDDDARTLADEAAAFVRERFARLETLPESLEHLSTAIGTNLAVVELVWEGLSLVETVTVPSWRLVADPQSPGQVQVMTGEQRTGVAATSPKFVVHVPQSASGFHLLGSLMHAQAFVYLTKQLAIADWAVFCELFGMPVRTATYEPTATPDEKKELVDMMKNMGTRAFAVFSRAVQFEMKESSHRGTAPFEGLVNFCDRTQAKAWLGGHLTSDTTGGTGTYAAGAIQNEVREDLRDDDIQREGRTVRSRIIGPMCAFRFPRRDVPLPFFRRVKPEVIDRVKEADLFVKAQQAGLTIGRAYAHNRLGIPEPQEDEETLTPSLDAFGEGLQEGMDAGA